MTLTPCMRFSPSPLRAGLLAGLALAALGALQTPVQAQRVVPKLGNICPMGYVDTLNGKCSTDRKSTRLNSSHSQQSRMPSSA